MTIFAPYAFELVSMVDTDDSDVGGQDTPWEVTVRPIGITLSEACFRLRRNKELLAYSLRIEAGAVVFHSFETNEIYRALGLALPRPQNEPQQSLEDFCRSVARGLFWLSNQERQIELSHYDVDLARAIAARIPGSNPIVPTLSEDAPE